MDLLVALAHRADETVSKEELLDIVWQGAHVVESVVPKTVSVLRSALGDRADRPVYILTVPRRGYRLIAPVTRPTSGTSSAAGSERRQSVESNGGPWALVGVSTLAVAVCIVWIVAELVWLDHPAADHRPLQIERLAVAPFSEPGSDELLGTALRSELLSDLSRLGRPVVTPLTAPDGASNDWLSAGRELGADAVLQGRVTDLGDRVRIDIELIDTRSGFETWSVNAERRSEDLWMLRTDVASSLVQRLGGVTEPVDPARAMPPDTYRTYLEARYLWSRRSRSGITQARDLFEVVTLRAPDFAEGLAWLAIANVTYVNYFHRDTQALSEAAVAAADRAVQLAPQLATARLAAGLVAMNVDSDPDGAIAEYRAALELSPNSATAHQYLAEALSAAGEHESAVAAADAAVALDPLAPLYRAVRGLVLYSAGRWEEAVVSLDRVLVLDPGFWWTLRYRAFALWRLGDHPGAARDLVRLTTATGHHEAGIRALESEMEADGLRGYFRWRLRLYEEGISQGHSVRPMELAEALAGVGRVDESLQQLERAAIAGQGEYFYHWRTSPAFDELRDDPRFRSLYDTDS